MEDFVTIFAHGWTIIIGLKYVLYEFLNVFREIKERPKTAPNKNKKETTATKNRKTASGQTSEYCLS